MSIPFGYQWHNQSHSDIGNTFNLCYEPWDIGSNVVTDKWQVAGGTRIYWHYPGREKFVGWWCLPSACKSTLYWWGPIFRNNAAVYSQSDSDVSLEGMEQLEESYQFFVMFVCWYNTVHLLAAIEGNWTGEEALYTLMIKSTWPRNVDLSERNKMSKSLSVTDEKEGKVFLVSTSLITKCWFWIWSLAKSGKDTLAKTLLSSKYTLFFLTSLVLQINAKREVWDCADKAWSCFGIKKKKKSRKACSGDQVKTYCLRMTLHCLQAACWRWQ